MYKKIEGKYFSYIKDPAVGNHIERNIDAPFDQRLVSVKEVLERLDSTQEAQERIRELEIKLKRSIKASSEHHAAYVEETTKVERAKEDFDMACEDFNKQEKKLAEERENIKYTGEYLEVSHGFLRIMKPKTDFVFVLRVPLKDALELQAPTMSKGFERLRKSIKIIAQELEPDTKPEKEEG